MKISIVIQTLHIVSPAAHWFFLLTDIDQQKDYLHLKCERAIEVKVVAVILISSHYGMIIRLSSSRSLSRGFSSKITPTPGA